MKAIALSLMLLFPTLVFAAAAPPLPQDSKAWLDGKALQWHDLQGKVVLLNVWTFACWNSYRSLPWIVSLQKKFPEMQIIGIHSPEFAYEKDRYRMREVMKKYEVDYPQVLDDSHSYWRNLNNRYWPAFYVVDKKGNLRGTFIGETHSDDAQAQKIEKLIQSLQEE